MVAIATTQPERPVRPVAAAVPALTLRRIGAGYRRAGVDVPVLRCVDLVVAAGEAVAVVGRSGSGKSTLLHIAGALATPVRGEVLIGTERLATTSAAARAVLRRRCIGFVFQSFHLLPGLTVAENVALPLTLDGVGSAVANRRALAVIDEVGIGHRAEHRPAELSGGEAQRAAMARALVTDPVLVLADEPTGNLDRETADDVLTAMLDRVRGRGAACVVVTHDDAIAARADRALHLTDGILA